MKNTGSIVKLGVAVAALGLAGAGGYVARAEGVPGAVNPRPLPGANAGTPASFADIIQRVAPAVVSIEVEGKAAPQRIVQFGSGGAIPFGDQGGGDGGPFDLRRFFDQVPGNQRPQTVHGAGSGFFISEDGYLVTNNHVIDGADKITVHTSDDRTFKARVIGRDAATDLAVLKVEAGGLPFVSFEDRAKPRVGDWVVAVGNPFNLGGSATAGIVSALGRQNVSGSSYVDFMQIDAPINRGNSGGPTFDLYGRVVGVNTAIFSPSGGSVGIGFDIPADVAATVTRQLISTGKISRGYIGATVQNVTPDIAESLGVDKTGALVADVVPGGPSDQGGLRSGDLVYRINGHPVTSAADLTRQVGQVHAGDTIRMDIRRDGQSRSIALKAGLRPSEDELAQNDSGFDGQGDGSGGAQGAGLLGMRLAPDSQGRGLRIAGLDGGSDAAQKGLRPGDIIEKAGQSSTRSSADLAGAVSRARAAGRKDVLLMVARNGQHIFVPIELGKG